MKKRILALLLTGAIAFTTVVPTEIFAAEVQEQNLTQIEETQTGEDDKDNAAAEAQGENLTQIEETQTSEDSENTSAAKGQDITQIEEAQTNDGGKDSLEPASKERASVNVSDDAGAPIEEEILNWKPPVGGIQEREVEVSPEIADATESINDGEGAEINTNGLEYSVKSSQKYDSSWDVYSSNYLYNRLSSKKKLFWDALDYVCRLYLNKSNLNADMDPRTGEAVARYSINYAKIGLTVTEAKQLYVMFFYSNPQYYFVDSSLLAYDYGGNWYVYLYGKFAKGSTRKSQTAKVKAKIDSMKKKVKKGKSDVEKARIAHDLIIKKIIYDPGMQYNRPYTPYHQSAYSVFCDDYTVCAGYTKAFAILMNSVGIDTIGVTSDGHAWNLTCFNDSWYNVDLTWDDMDGAYGYQTRYTYFGLSESKITGSMDQGKAHKKESFYKGLTPKCTKNFGSTLTKVGKPYRPTKRTATPTVKCKKTSSGITVTLKTSTSGATIYYTLDGKTPSSSFTRSYRYTKSFKIKSNKTLKAIAVCNGRWDSKVKSTKVNGKKYKVTFNSKGGNKISSKTVWSGATIKKPATPKRKGYRFVAWYKDKNCKKKWSFKTKITKNMTLYAKWKKK